MMTEQAKAQAFADALRKLTNYHIDEMDTLNVTLIDEFETFVRAQPKEKPDE